MGALDGKHTRICMPSNKLRECRESNKINRPAPDPLPNDKAHRDPTQSPPAEGQPDLCNIVQSKDIPYFLVGDDAFAMWPYMMKPHSKANMT